MVNDFYNHNESVQANKREKITVYFGDGIFLVEMFKNISYQIKLLL